MKTVEIYTDGACSGNPGKGGWCALIIDNGKEKIISGGEVYTTNNRMELTAVVEGLSALKEPCEVKLYSDSAYLVNAVEQGWIQKWLDRRWKTSDKTPVKNRDLWERIISLIKKHKIAFNKVKGHSNNVNNNRCDAIAREEVTKLP